MKNDKLGLRIYFLTKLIQEKIQDDTKDDEFTGTQGRVLHYLLGQKDDCDIFQKDIEFEFHIKRSTATELLQSLEKKDYIKRVPASYDARLKKIVLLPKAKALQPNVDKVLENVDDILKQDIASEELELLDELLEKMISNMRKAD